MENYTITTWCRNHLPSTTHGHRTTLCIVPKHPCMVPRCDVNYSFLEWKQKIVFYTDLKIFVLKTWVMNRIHLQKKCKFAMLAFNHHLTHVISNLKWKLCTIILLWTFPEGTVLLQFCLDMHSDQTDRQGHYASPDNTIQLFSRERSIKD